MDAGWPQIVPTRYHDGVRLGQLCRDTPIVSRCHPDCRPTHRHVCLVREMCFSQHAEGRKLINFVQALLPEVPSFVANESESDVSASLEVGVTATEVVWVAEVCESHTAHVLARARR